MFSGPGMVASGWNAGVPGLPETEAWDADQMRAAVEPGRNVGGRGRADAGRPRCFSSMPAIATILPRRAAPDV